MSHRPLLDDGILLED